MFATLSLIHSVLFLLAFAASGESTEQDEKYLQFPPKFLLGVATAAYQIEGAWNVSDKGESTWDRYTHLQNGRVYNNDTGDVAANSYYKYKEDVALIKQLGFNTYRFSVSWPRILPTGFANSISTDVLEDAGGWLNSEIVDWFGDYARIVFEQYAPKVKKFIPINEPSAVCKNGYSIGIHAPGKTLHGFGYMPRSADDEYAAEVSFQFNIGWTMHPIYSEEGDYPPIMKNLVSNKSLKQGYLRSRLPTFTPEWINYTRGASDFLAINHYTTRLVTNGSMGRIPSHENDQGIVEVVDSFWKGSASEWLKVVPEGFRYILQQLSKYYGNPPMYITENGVSDYGTLDDDDRIFYFREYLKQMLLAIHVDGVNVKGYMVWSLLDNFEWDKGYNEHFGIVSVDFNDPERPRTLKKSASWWKKVIAARRIDTS
ncbi:Myrosinase 1 [Anthophora retusa]